MHILSLYTYLTLIIVILFILITGSSRTSVSTEGAAGDAAEGVPLSEVHESQPPVPVPVSSVLGHAGGVSESALVTVIEEDGISGKHTHPSASVEIECKDTTSENKDEDNSRGEDIDHKDNIEVVLVPLEGQSVPIVGGDLNDDDGMVGMEMGSGEEQGGGEGIETEVSVGDEEDAAEIIVQEMEKTDDHQMTEDEGEREKVIVEVGDVSTPSAGAVVLHGDGTTSIPSTSSAALAPSPQLNDSESDSSERNEDKAEAEDLFDGDLGYASLNRNELEEEDFIYHGEWLETIDPASGHPYYVNQITGESSWELPPPLPDEQPL